MVRTKLQIPAEQVRDIIARAMGERVVAQDELTEGSFARLWRARLAGGREVVLKLAPSGDAELLSYERDIIRTEALFYELTAHTGVPGATLLHTDLDGPIKYLIMSAIDGVSWDSANGKVDEPDRRRLRRELGRHVAALHRITGTAYGYPQQPAMTAASWRTAFLSMIDGVLADGARFGADLPLPIEQIAHAVHASAHVLDDVRQPVLVHFDLWPGNILLDLTGARPEIAGLVDHERAFWGDPAAEFVSLDVFGAAEQDEDLLAGYREAGGRLEPTASLRTRLALYRSYLYLIMLIEAGPRGFSGPAVRRLLALTARSLRAQLRVLTGDTAAAGDTAG
jgi:aminoglycoside phosphotransferase (APT) family kinase protein